MLPVPQLECLEGLLASQQRQGVPTTETQAAIAQVNQEIDKSAEEIRKQIAADEQRWEAERNARCAEIRKKKWSDLTVEDHEMFGECQRVQRRLACSVGGSPTGAMVRSPVAWVAFVEETKRVKPTDKAIPGMVSESPGRNLSELRGGLDRK
jgi:hypothetical protein